MFPLRLGDPEDFARVAAALRGRDFEESAVHRILRDTGNTALGAESIEPKDAGGLDSSVLLKLFIELKPVPRAEVEAAMDRATLDSFLALDLVRRGDADCLASPVFLYPVGEMLIASDHYDKSSGADSVFPAIQTGTLHLLKLLSRGVVDDALDLCSGTGICALVLSRHVRHAVAADVTARAGHFAEFNRRLNDCRNVEIACGDLYGPVQGRTFDRIVAHPPYMPSAEDAKIWRDGGSTGEAITRRIVEGLPTYLRPGGDFLALCLGSERDEAPFHLRAREWLGEAEAEFNLIFAVRKYLSPEELAGQIAGGENAGGLERAFREAGVTRFCYGALAIQRHEGAGTRPWTMRTKLGANTGADSFEAVFGRSRECARPGALADLVPRLAPAARATVTHRVDESKFVATDVLMETEFPFAHAMKFEPWIFPLAARFDGSRNVARVYAEARAEEAVPANFQFEDFVSLVAMLIIQGYLTIDTP
jgi:hypothetical protein